MEKGHLLINEIRTKNFFTKFMPAYFLETTLYQPQVMVYDSKPKRDAYKTLGKFLFHLGKQLQLIGLKRVQSEVQRALAPYPVFLTGQGRTLHLQLVWHRPSPCSSHLRSEKTVFEAYISKRIFAFQSFLETPLFLHSRRFHL